VTDWLPVAGASLLTAALLMTATALWSRRAGRVSVVDVAWGLGFVAVAVVAAVVGQALVGADGSTGDALRRWLVPVLTGVWGIRLAAHIHRRSRGGGEDPRYAEILGDGGFAAAVRKVFLVQGAAIWVVSLPVQVSATEPVWTWWLVGLGVAVWALGLTFEAVGDAQLAAYKREPRESRPPVMDRGLWGWTRHPNYFGDAAVWWGLWLAGGLASGWLPGLLTVVAPLVMTHFLRNVSGARLLERSMSRREGWEEYAARTPYFFPRPPRRG
jgi:steroid 5-alpha reductase family enzyme